MTMPSPALNVRRPTRRPALWILATLCLLALPGSGGAQAANPQITEAEAVRLLASEDPEQRDLALRLAWELGPDAGPELRAAAIRAGWEEMRADINSESTALVARVVAVLEDPDAIPLLVEVMHTGVGARVTLANFGELALSGVLEKARHPAVTTFPRPASGHPDDIAIKRGSAALHVLRLMVERDLVGPEGVEKIREAARLRLEPPQHYDVLPLAIDLAVETEVAGLMPLLKTLARDTAAVEAMLFHPTESRVGFIVRKAMGEVERSGKPPPETSFGGPSFGTRRETPPKAQA